MNLKHIQLFLAIAQHQSLTKAAEVTFMSQPAASLGLSSLESELGVKLFDRVGRAMLINDNGQRFYAEAEALYLQAQRCKQLFALSDNDVLSGALLIGASNTIANYYLPKMLAQFKSIHSQTEIEMMALNTQEVIDALLKHKIDVGYIEGYCSHGQLIHDVVQDENLVLICGAHHPLSQLQTIKPSDLSGYQWCLREIGSGTRQVMDALLAQHKITVSSSINLCSNEAVVNYTRESEVLACVPEKMFEYMSLQGIKILKVEGVVLQRQIVRLIHKDKHISDVMNAWKVFAR